MEWLDQELDFDVAAAEACNIEGLHSMHKLHIDCVEDTDSLEAAVLDLQLLVPFVELVVCIDFATFVVDSMLVGAVAIAEDWDEELLVEIVAKPEVVEFEVEPEVVETEVVGSEVDVEPVGQVFGLVVLDDVGTPVDVRVEVVEPAVVAAAAVEDDTTVVWPSFVVDKSVDSVADEVG